MLQQTFLNFFSLNFMFLPFLHDIAYKDFLKLLELTLKEAENEKLWYIITHAEDGLVRTAEFSLCCSDA